MPTQLRALVVFTLIFVAFAADAAPTGHEKNYKAAVQLESAGRISEALAAFEGIPVAARDWATRSHIAGCLEKLGRLRAARAAHEVILTDKALAPAERETTESNLADLVTRLPKIRVRTAQGAKDLTVSIDDESRSRARGGDGAIVGTPRALCGLPADRIVHPFSRG